MPNPRSSPTGEAGEARCGTCGEEADAVMPMVFVKSANTAYPCRDPFHTASESKSGGEGAGKTWTFIRHENGATTWHEGTNGVDPPFGKKVEVSPASSLTEALSLLAEAREQIDRELAAQNVLLRERDQAETALHLRQGERDRAEAQLAQARAALEEIANAPDKFADAIADGALTKSGLAELMANSARTALSNTTPETRA